MMMRVNNGFFILLLLLSMLSNPTINAEPTTGPGSPIPQVDYYIIWILISVIVILLLAYVGIALLFTVIIPLCAMILTVITSLCAKIRPHSRPKPFRPSTHLGDLDSADLECVVCLSEFGDNETLRLLPQCLHVFHPYCIDVWLASHDTCPVCRTKVDREQSHQLVSRVQLEVELSQGQNDDAVVITVVNEDQSTI